MSLKRRADKVSKQTTIIVSGFGGQGSLFCGKFLACIGMAKGQQVSWLPSYGPEMRGGTARCGVVLSDTPIGSPLVTHPDILVAMNLPSFLAFESVVKPGGTMFYDASLFTRPHARTDITYHALTATQIAEDNGMKGLAGMVLAGAALALLPGVDAKIIETAMVETVSEGKKEMIENNIKAVNLGLSVK
jgi:2-oxoglutarate ferredoxin oxidoreductase subunit gamma